MALDNAERQWRASCWRGDKCQGCRCRDKLNEWQMMESAIAALNDHNSVGPAVDLATAIDQHTPFHCGIGNFRLRRNQPFEALTFA
jgi:hypothetical protein